MDRVEIIHRTEQRTSTWSGGTTTEIALYPTTAAYSRRDFLWRVSSATIEADESNFTLLPGFQRLIMILEGELELEHVGHHRVRLVPFEQDAFEGGWITHSRGTARDFNVMLAASCTGQIWSASVQRNATVAVPVARDRGIDAHMNTALMVYSVDGELNAEVVGSGSWRIETGDALLLTNVRHQMAKERVLVGNGGPARARTVVARISYPGSP